jgi:predicted RNA binding protein YcfA (HicA-like mRNA interferase family)
MAERGIIIRMSKRQKILKKILAGSRNVAFDDFLLVAEGFGFHLSRMNGSHHIFVNPNIRELVNIQNVNGQVKPYQLRQFIELVERYNLVLEN